MLKTLRRWIERARQRYRPSPVIAIPPPLAPHEWRIRSLTPLPQDDARDSSALLILGERSNSSCAFRLYIPAHAQNTTLPLMVMLHGCRQDAESFAAGTRMNSLADQHGFAVLYPEQSLNANPMGCWNWFSTLVMNGASESAMLVRLVRTVLERYPLDHRRVYLVGMSAGGAMARVLSVCYPDIFAACVSHSGVMYRAATSGLNAFTVMKKGSRLSPVDTAQRVLRTQPRARFVPTLVIHGMDDDAVNPVNASQTALQAETLAQVNQSARFTELLQQRRDGGRDYSIRDQLLGGRVVVREILVKGLGHAWSGGDASLPFNDAHGPNASELAWQFVSQYQR